MCIRLLALALVLLLCDSAQAQGMINISLERGRLRIDGQTVPDALVPPTLDLQRIEGRMHYSGPSDATFDVGGVRYRIQGRRFVLDHAPNRAADVLFDADHRFDLRMGGYVFVPVDWTSDPQAARELHFAAQQEFVLDATAVFYADQIRLLAPDDPQRQRLVQHLRSTLEETFDLKQRNRLHEIELLEAEIRFLRAQHQKRTGYRSEIVEQRLQALLSGE